MPPVARSNKLDVLFVVDNSNSMCEEQQRLSQQLEQLARLLSTELTHVDYRIAAVSTDIGAQTSPPQGNIGQRGKLLYAPAAPNEPVCNNINGQPYAPNTADCDAEADPVISAELLNALPPAAREAELARQLRCRVTLGIGGFYYEKGLEAMRLALSCDGPNAERFSACCVAGEAGRLTYDPSCPAAAAEAPSFLRPDAALAVVILSDENDCSTPADDLLGGCVGEMCDIEYSQNIECEWRRERLTPVGAYVDFLRGLKRDPAQLFVLPIVGFRAYTEAGNEISYSSGQIDSPLCFGDDPALLNSEECCPGGDCVGVRQVQPSCKILERGVIAYAGTRYLQLAEQLGAQGLGCPAGNEPERLASGEPAPGTGGACLSICNDDYSDAMNALTGRLQEILPAP